MDNEDMTKLVKLQVFIDHAFGHPRPPRPEGSIQLPPDAVDPVWDRQHAISSFLHIAVRDTAEYREMSQCLRKTESYAIVNFMLNESAGEKIEALSARYGVSPGHFRRLFRKATGRTPKAEVKDWQLARAVLEFVDGSRSITDIASGHGYASPSHFSNEARKALGASLTQLIGA